MSGEDSNVCGEFVWDGPYRMICGRLIIDGECLTHGRGIQLVVIKQQGQRDSEVTR